MFDPLEFIAETTQHVPNHGEHAIHYFGFYSNKVRGMRAKSESAEVAEKCGVEILECGTPFRKVCCSRWAAMIQKVYEVDPLLFIAKWENPNPNDKIESIDIISNGKAIPGVVAITGERAE